MKPSAILYQSNTGYTRQYALMLGEKTGLPVYSLDEAEEKLPRWNPVIFLGWLMAGKVQGYARAARCYHVEAVCGVGMGAAGSQLEDVRRANAFPAQLPVFTLQGGFDMERLHGIYGLMMRLMGRVVGQKLARKAERTPEEEDMLTLFTQGGSRVSEQQLDGVCAWYQQA